MATTKAFELAQLSALTEVDASGNVSASTNKIANASGDLTFDSAADIILNVDGGDLRLYDDTLQFGRIANDSTDLVIEAYVADRSLIFKGLDGTTPITALTIDMSASGAATFLDQVTIGGNLIHAGNLTIDAGGDITLNADGADVILADGAVEFGRFKRDSGHLVIKSETIDKSVIIKGTTTSNAVVTALTFDMANSGRATFNENVVIQGDLTVQGSTVTLSTTTLDVEDKNITLNHGSGDTSGSADGAGITIQDAVSASTDATILWNASSNGFDFSHAILTKGGGDNQVYFTGGNDSTSGRQLTLSTEAAGSQNNAIHRLTVPSGYGSFNVTVNAKERFKINNNGDISSYNDASSNAVKMLWDASHESLNIGEVGSSTDRRLNVSGTGPQTATTQFGVVVNPTMSDDVTGSVYNIYSQANLASGATLTNLYSVYIGATSLNGSSVTNNYGLYQAGNEKNYFGGNVGIGTTPVTALHVDPGYVTLGTSTGTDNSWINNVEDGNLELVNEGRSTNEGAVRINRKNNPAGDTTHFRDTVIYDGKSNVVLFVDGSEGKVGIGTDSPDATLHVVGPAGRPTDLASVDTASTAQFQSDASNLHSLYIAENANGSTIQVTDGTTNSSTAKPLALQPFGGNVSIGLGTHAPEAKLHISGNSDVSDEDCMLIIEDVDGSVGSRIPAIVFRSRTGGSTTNQGRIRGTGHEGMVLSASSAFGDDLVVKDTGVGVGKMPVHKLDVDGAIAASQVRHSIRPALNLDFANSKQLDSRITFYRNSIATYYDSEGTLRYATQNEPRFDHNPATGESKGLLIEEPRDFLNTNSITINGGYWSFSNASASVKQALAPDGTYSADGLVSNTVNDGHGILKSFVPIANTYYTLTAYFKRGANRYAQIAWYYNEAAGSSNYPTAYFDLDNGTFNHSSGINRGTTMTDVGNGWYRCSVTVLTDSTPSSSYFYATSTASGSAAAYVGTGAIDTYFWGLQIEIGDNPSSFTPSDTHFASRSTTATYQDEFGTLKTAPVNAERYSHRWDGQNWVETGLLLEKAIVQIAPDTESIGNPYYRSSYTRESIRTTLPTGSIGPCVKMVMNNGGSASAATALGYYLGAMPRTQNTAYNTSVFAKALDEDGFRIRDGLSTGAFLDVNLTTGAITNNATSTFLDVKAEKYAHGWWRISFTYLYTGSTSTGSWLAFRSSNNGNGTKGYAIWGFQITTDGLASYIPNVSTSYSAVTQAADVFTGSNYIRQADEVDMIGKNLTSWYNPNGGSFYTEHDSIQGNANHWIWSLNDERTLYNHIDQLRGRLRVSPDVGNYADINGGVTLVSGTFSKLASRIKKDDFALSMDGNTVVTDTSADYERNSTLLKIGARADGAGYLNGTLKVFRYYAKPLSNAELEALTENN